MSTATKKEIKKVKKTKPVTRDFFGDNSDVKIQRQIVKTGSIKGIRLG